MNLRPVLIVGGGSADIELVKDVLATERLSNKIVVMEDGRAALDYLCCNGDLSQRNLMDIPEFVLLFHNQPGMNCIEVMKSIKSNSRTKRIPLIVITSSDTEPELGTCYDLRVNSIIRKSADQERYREMLMLICRYWLELNQPPPISG